MFRSLCVFALMLSAVSPAAADSELNASKLKASQQSAYEFLKTTQSDNGLWSSPDAVGISGLVTYGLLRSGYPTTDPVVEKALGALEKFAQPDGRICAPNSRISGYETAVVYMALAAANQSGKYSDLLKNSEKFIRGLQLDESADISSDNSKYGGVGYGPGGGGRPDMSNTAFFLEALQASGATSDDPAVKKALVFISRCQNLESQYNNSPAAAAINDGGFHYTANGPGGQPARNAEEAPRSYGSMTYAGLKSMLYAGLTPEDERVKGALDWIRKSYTVKENPGMGDNGLFYYYQLFAKALDAAGDRELKDSSGVSHDWKAELANQLMSIQQANGSWVNTSPRWMEGDPNLATAFALIALSHCQPGGQP